MSQRICVSRSKTRAAFAVGATPITGRSWVWRSATARSSIDVLPAPAGPTTTTRRSWPAIARAASVWHTSNPTTFTVVDGVGVGELGVGRPHHDPFLLGEDLFGGEVRGERIDPHRPAITPPRRRGGGVRVEVDAVFEDLVAGPLQRLRPAVS